MDIDAAPDQEVMTRSRARRERRRPPVGLIALGVVIGVIALEIVGVSLASHGEYAVATIIGQFVIALTIVPFVLGLVAAITGWNRRSGVAAMALSVLANPLVLNALLKALDGS